MHLSKQWFPLWLFLAILVACQPRVDQPAGAPRALPGNVIGSEHQVTAQRATDTLHRGSTYLSVYPEIYSFSQRQVHPLTATVSLRNISSTDTVFVQRADYYNTGGTLVHAYVEKPIYLKPLETIEIVIDEANNAGGTGANFIFEWSSPHARTEPRFEAVMISTAGQQGLSFVTQGIRR